MANMTIYDYIPAVAIDGSTHWLLIQPGDNSNAYKRINRETFLGVTGQPVDVSTSQNIFNKSFGNTNDFTIRDDRLILQDNADTTKQATFQLSGITTGTSRIFTLPDRSSTIATLGGAQTFTGANNFTGSSWSGGTIDNATVTVDAVSGHTTPNSGTVYGMSITSGTIASGGLASNAVTTAKIADSAVTPAKLVAGSGTSWVWQPFTPTFTNLSVGNGTVTGLVNQTGKTVRGTVDITFGSTTSISGAVYVNFPGTLTPRTYSQFHNLGLGTFYDASALTAYPATTYWDTSARFGIFALAASGSYASSNLVSSTVPYTWTTSDRISVSFEYEVA